MGKTLRSLYRTTLGLPFLFGALFVLMPLQRHVITPLLKKPELLSRLVHKGVRGLFGVKVEFNEKSAPIEKNKPTWYFANHPSAVDPFVIAREVSNNFFVAAGWLTRIPGIAAIGKAGRILFVSQKKNEEDKKRDRGLIVQAFNSGSNVVMFPEGWTNDGQTVELFRAGLASLLYDAPAQDKSGNAITLDKDVVVQPIAIRVKSVEGKDAIADKTLRAHYSMSEEKNYLKRIWKRMGFKEVTLELMAFEPMTPQNFADAKELMNDAHRKITSIVAPDQKTITKAPIEATEGEKQTIRPLQM